MEKNNVRKGHLHQVHIAPAIQRAGWDISVRSVKSSASPRGASWFGASFTPRQGSPGGRSLPPAQPSFGRHRGQRQPSLGRLKACSKRWTMPTRSMCLSCFPATAMASLFHDRTGTGAQLETELTLDEFPARKNFGADIANGRGWTMKSARRSGSLTTTMAPGVPLLLPDQCC